MSFQFVVCTMCTVPWRGMNSCGLAQLSRSAIREGQQQITDIVSAVIMKGVR